MAADYDRTSFGIRRTQEVRETLDHLHALLLERIAYVADDRKRSNLLALLVDVETVLKDLS